jgi:hypothetical protein
MEDENQDKRDELREDMEGRHIRYFTGANSNLV